MYESVDTQQQGVRIKYIQKKHLQTDTQFICCIVVFQESGDWLPTLYPHGSYPGGKIAV